MKLAFWILILILVIFQKVKGQEVKEINKCYKKFCFHFENEKTENLKTAVEKCQKKNMKLLEIYDEELQKCFEDFKSKSDDLKQFETFLNMYTSDNKWKWIKKEIEKKLNSIKNDDSFRVGALILNSDNKIEYSTYNLDHKLRNWICELCFKKKWENNKNCFEGKNSENEITWFEALNNCVKNNGSLSEKDFDFDNFPENLKSLKPNTPHWVGLARWSYKWSDKETPVLYSNWLNGNPPTMDTEGDNCPHVIAKNSLWSIDNCQTTRNVVCMKNLDSDKEDKILKKLEKLEENFQNLKSFEIIILLFVLIILVLLIVLILILYKIYKKKIFEKKQTQIEEDQNKEEADNEKYPSNSKTSEKNKKESNNLINTNKNNMKNENKTEEKDTQENSLKKNKLKFNKDEAVEKTEEKNQMERLIQ